MKYLLCPVVFGVQYPVRGILFETKGAAKAAKAMFKPDIDGSVVVTDHVVIPIRELGDLADDKMGRGVSNVDFKIPIKR